MGYTEFSILDRMPSAFTVWDWQIDNMFLRAKESCSWKSGNFKPPCRWQSFVCSRWRRTDSFRNPRFARHSEEWGKWGRDRWNCQNLHRSRSQTISTHSVPKDGWTKPLWFEHLSLEMPPGKASHWGQESEASRREGHGRNDVPEKSEIPHLTFFSLQHQEKRFRCQGSLELVHFLHHRKSCNGIPTVLCPSFVKLASMSCFWWPPGTAWSGHKECSWRAGVLPGHSKAEGICHSYVLSWDKPLAQKTSRCISCQHLSLIISRNFLACLACKGSTVYDHHISIHALKSNLWGQGSRFRFCGTDKVEQQSEG